MTRKAITVWLLCLVVWNGAFGAFGGLLLCLHQDLSVHVDAELEAGVACDSEHPEVVDSCLSEAETCVDIELSGKVLPPTRLDEVEAICLSTMVPLLAVMPAYFDVLPSLESFPAGVAPTRGPPPVVAMSLQVVGFMQLRV